MSAPELTVALTRLQITWLTTLVSEAGHLPLDEAALALNTDTWFALSLALGEGMRAERTERVGVLAGADERTWQEMGA